MSISLNSLFAGGGMVMWPMLIFSIITWAVVVERAYVFFTWRPKIRRLSNGIADALRAGDKTLAKKLCESEKSEVSQVFLSAIDGKKNREATERLVDRQRARITQFFKRNLWILGTIGSASPFIGLLGTVVGIVRAFSDMAEKGSGGFAVVAGGISEALIATAAGLIVAIVALLAYNIFVNATNQTLQNLKLSLEELMDSNFERV